MSWSRNTQLLDNQVARMPQRARRRGSRHLSRSVRKDRHSRIRRRRHMVCRFIAIRETNKRAVVT